MKAKNQHRSTGFEPDFSWIELDVTDESGWPRTRRGVSEALPGLFFVGMPYQFGSTSGFIGGVEKDADYVVGHIFGANSIG